jgi:hypothetical protein
VGIRAADRAVRRLHAGSATGCSVEYGQPAGERQYLARFEQFSGGEQRGADTT